MSVVSRGLMRQVDQTTCGSAVLVALRAAGQGRLHEILSAADETLFPEQAGMKLATCRHAVGPFPWPSAWGTPPWTAAREAHYPGVRYRVSWLAPLRRPRRDSSVIRAAYSAARRGIPVPLYVGGACGAGVRGLPRHVVLIVGARQADDFVPLFAGDAVPSDAVWRIYEPASGTIHDITTAELCGKTACPAFGGWSHLWAALIPYPEDH